MKFTKRTDGQMKATVLIQFTVTRANLTAEVEEWLASLRDRDARDFLAKRMADDPKKARLQVEQRLRDRATRYGDVKLEPGASGASDYWEAADSIVAFLWPELGKAGETCGRCGKVGAKPPTSSFRLPICAECWEERS